MPRWIHVFPEARACQIDICLLFANSIQLAQCFSHYPSHLIGPTGTTLRIHSPSIWLDTRSWFIGKLKKLCRFGMMNIILYFHIFLNKKCTHYEYFKHFLRMTYRSSFFQNQNLFIHKIRYSYKNCRPHEITPQPKTYRKR